MKPKLQMFAAFVAGVVVCFAWYQFAATRYTVTTAGSRTFKVDRISGATWQYNTGLGQWVEVRNR